MSQRDEFEAHIKSTAWYRVLSESAKDDDEGASVFRMARMAASEAWQAAEAQALERAAIECDQLSRKQGTLGRIVAAQDCAEAIRALQREEGEK